MSLDRVIESRIQDAMAAGAFDNLEGAGKPLAFTEQELLAGENWLGYKILQNGGLVPEWLGLAREIERDIQRLQLLDEQHAALAERCHATGEWARHALALQHAERRFEELARAVRAKQDRFNFDAPGIRSERSAIWVEHHLARLRARVPQSQREADAPR